ncbi:hypothetical protein HAX54_045450 [Datura stramonium]|uniref:NB-ARC domain-containing protein n=1 Tax=Datura stramonium TaxID=4076 RepID=A0ABS8SQY5_DATST|nr:hypothetical protein [Datura stramonium]
MHSDKFRSKIFNFLETPRRIEEECHSFLIFFEKYLFSKESHPLVTVQWIEEELGEKYLSSLDGFKFMDIILNLIIFNYRSDAINKIRGLFRASTTDLIEIYSGEVRPWSDYFMIMSEFQRLLVYLLNDSKKDNHDFLEKIQRSSNLDVISISGMPRVGKTTLVNKLYFDQSIISDFDIRAKTCVSQQYTLKNVLLTILGDVIGKNAKLDKEAKDALAVMLQKKLSHAKYLIFIDDILHVVHGTICILLISIVS